MEMAILIIDDDEDIRELFYENLKTDFYVDTADTGKNALSIFKKKKHDIVLLDIRLPDIDGITLLGRFKKISPEVAITIITAYPDVDIAVNALKHGAMDFYTKPYNLKEIKFALKKLSNLLKGKKSYVSMFQYQNYVEKEYVIPPSFTKAEEIMQVITNDLDKICARINNSAILPVAMAVSEIIINAIEHGSLEINRKEKGHAFEKGYLTKLVAERLKIPKFKKRNITIRYRIEREKIEFHIIDMGKGFKIAELPDPSSDARMYNGRGIFLARIYTDELFYKDDGKHAVLIKYLKSQKGLKR